MDEILLINKYIKPLVANTKEALGLQDDVAVISSNKSKGNNSQITQIITTDCMLEGKHFFKGENPKSIAYRLMLANLSDLASKGATPKFFTLTFCPRNIKELKTEWLEIFFNTIKELQEKYKVKLIGGNTATTGSTLMLSITLIGEVEAKKSLPFRFKANKGDLIFVSNFMGDAFLGYSIIVEEKRLIKQRPPFWLAALNKKEQEYLINGYYYPKVMLALGKDLLGITNASTDASDGAMLAVNNIAKESKLAAMVALPLQAFSAVAQKVLKLYQKPSNIISLNSILPDLINWGGDYNLIFTVPKHKVPLLKKIQVKYLKTGITITKIGQMIADDTAKVPKKPKLTILDFNNNKIQIDLNKNIHK